MKTDMKKIIMFLATGAYFGKIPFAPGTWGTLVGLPICYGQSFMTWPVQFMIIIFFMPIAAWISGQAEQNFGKKDPGAIVIDEIAGIMITLAYVPFTFLNVIAGFLLFRFFDILKPYPISKAEDYFQGGTAVLMDDVIAGIFARVILEIFLI
jgi:phosphatidylglycerophosphatase A